MTPTPQEQPIDQSNPPDVPSPANPTVAANAEPDLARTDAASSNSTSSTETPPDLTPEDLPTTANSTLPEPPRPTPPPNDGYAVNASHHLPGDDANVPPPPRVNASGRNSSTHSTSAEAAAPPSRPHPPNDSSSPSLSDTSPPNDSQSSPTQARSPVKPTEENSPPTLAPDNSTTQIPPDQEPVSESTNPIPHSLKREFDNATDGQHQSPLNPGSRFTVDGSSNAIRVNPNTQDEQSEQRPSPAAPFIDADVPIEESKESREEITTPARVQNNAVVLITTDLYDNLPETVANVLRTDGTTYRDYFISILRNAASLIGVTHLRPFLNTVLNYIQLPHNRQHETSIPWTGGWADAEMDFCGVIEHALICAAACYDHNKPRSSREISREQQMSDWLNTQVYDPIVYLYILVHLNIIEEEHATAQIDSIRACPRPQTQPRLDMENLDSDTLIQIASGKAPLPSTTATPRKDKGTPSNGTNTSLQSHDTEDDTKMPAMPNGGSGGQSATRAGNHSLSTGERN